jgi:CheY-like chemotaxis protein
MLKAILIDDEQENINGLTIKLGMVCPEVEVVGSFTNPAEALQVLRSTGADLVFLDVEMPGLDGMAVGRALRCDPRTASALITMHTSLDEDKVRAGFSHYDAFVPKSASPLALGERVHGLLLSRRV